MSAPRVPKSRGSANLSEELPADGPVPPCSSSYSNNYSTMFFETFRRSYLECRELLSRRLAEPAPGRIQLLSGPRQVGQTTLLLEIAGEVGKQAVYAAADAAEGSLPGF